MAPPVAVNDWAGSSKSASGTPGESSDENESSHARSGFSLCGGMDIRSWLAANTTFFRLHFSYFCVLSLIGGLVLWGIEVAAGKPQPYVDQLFMAVSAASQTGLYTLDLSQKSIATQVILVLIMCLGSPVLGSAVPVVLRRRYFEINASSMAETERERQELLESSQAEYRALGWVLSIVITYWTSVIVVSFLLLGIYSSQDPWMSSICASRSIDPWWFALFTAVSSFHNAGFSVFQDNLIPVYNNAYVLIVVSMNIMLGNVGYPVAFRFIVWTLHKIYPEDAALKFLLDRPRKCFTHMFRAPQTRLLLLCIVGFTLIEFFFFLGLDYGAPFLASVDPQHRVLIGWFSAISTRTAGFNVVDISLIAPSMQILYAVFMYLSALPVVVSMRKSTDQAAQEEVIMEEVSAAGVILDPGPQWDDPVLAQDDAGGGQYPEYASKLAGVSVQLDKDGRLARTPVVSPLVKPEDGPKEDQGLSSLKLEDSGPASLGISSSHPLERKGVVELPKAHMEEIEERTGEGDETAKAGASFTSAPPEGSPVARSPSPTGHSSGSPSSPPVESARSEPRTPVEKRRLSQVEIVAIRRANGAMPPGGLLNLPGDGFPVLSPEIAAVAEEYVSSSDSEADVGIRAVRRQPAKNGKSKSRMPPHPVLEKARSNGSSRPASANMGAAAAVGARKSAHSLSKAPSSSTEMQASSPQEKKGTGTGAGAPVDMPVRPLVKAVVEQEVEAVLPKPTSAVRQRLTRDLGGSSTLDMGSSFRLPPSGAGAASVNVAGFVIEDEASKSVLMAGRDLLNREAPLLLLALFVISIAEGEHIQQDRYSAAGAALSLWPIIFEIASAYGTVGLSLGYPGSPLSLSAKFSTFSKLVVMLIMMAGRHRGLPVSIDPAVHLPSLLRKKPKRTLGQLGGSFGSSFHGGSFSSQPDPGQLSVRSFLPTEKISAAAAGVGRFFGLNDESSAPAASAESPAGATFGDNVQAQAPPSASLQRGMSFVSIPGKAAKMLVPLPASAMQGPGPALSVLLRGASHAHLTVNGRSMGRGALSIGHAQVHGARGGRGSIGTGATPGVGATGTVGSNRQGSTGAGSTLGRGGVRRPLAAVFSHAGSSADSRGSREASAHPPHGSVSAGQVEIEMTPAGKA